METSKKEAFSIQFLQILDVIVILCSAMAAMLAWNVIAPLIDQLGWFKLNLTYYKDVYIIPPIAWGIAPFAPLVLEMFGFYRDQYRRRVLKVVMPVIQAVGVVVACVVILGLLMKSPPPHRPFVILFIVSSILGLLLRELALQWYYKSKGSDSARRTSVMLVGNTANITEWVDSLPEHSLQRMKIVEKVDLMTHNIEDVVNILEDNHVERAIFLVRDVAFDKVTRAIEACEIQGVEAWVAADFVRARIAQPTFDSINGQSMLVLRSTPALSWAVLAKSLIDRVGAFLLILVTSPFWLLAYIGIKVQSPGPVFYRQERAGRYGKPFMMWKFRSMIMDADKKLEELKKQSGNEMSGPVFKLDHDPRIFPFGRFIRKYSIDELPQLLNVLVGDMSLVGPRPMAVYELPEIEKSEHRRKLSVRPGITCIWQVSGRNTITDFDSWVKLDLDYIDNWSLWLDIKILLQTVPAVLFAKGSK